MKSSILVWIQVRMGKLDREAQISEVSALDLSDALFDNRKGGARLIGLEKAGRIRFCDRNIKSGETVIFSRTVGVSKAANGECLRNLKLYPLVMVSTNDEFRKCRKIHKKVSALRG
jgi:hypothetical protein